MEDVDKHILIRAVGLSALGKLDSTTIKLAAQLDIHTMKEQEVLTTSWIRIQSKSI
jgi:hypothetical protein